MDEILGNRDGKVSIKLYLQKQVAGQIWPQGNRVLILDLRFWSFCSLYSQQQLRKSSTFLSWSHQTLHGLTSASGSVLRVSHVSHLLSEPTLPNKSQVPLQRIPLPACHSILKNQLLHLRLEIHRDVKVNPWITGHGCFRS